MAKLRKKVDERSIIMQMGEGELVFFFEIIFL